MNHSAASLLTERELSALSDALHYMKMFELKKACEHIDVSAVGKKAELIRRIMTFVQTGQTIGPSPMPASSLAKSYAHQSMSAEAWMLYGAYKNDAKARLFFKKLIGPHFHFTAYGIDWLNDRWMQGKPPTYQEFVDYWIQETERRKRQKVPPKAEWALINFMQHTIKLHPDVSRDELMHTWKVKREQEVQRAWALLNRVVKSH